MSKHPPWQHPAWPCIEELGTVARPSDHPRGFGADRPLGMSTCLGNTGVHLRAGSGLSPCAASLPRACAQVRFALPRQGCHAVTPPCCGVCWGVPVGSPHDALSHQVTATRSWQICTWLRTARILCTAWPCTTTTTSGTCSQTWSSPCGREPTRLSAGRRQTPFRYRNSRRSFSHRGRILQKDRRVQNPSPAGELIGRDLLQNHGTLASMIVGTVRGGHGWLAWMGARVAGCSRLR